MCRTVCRSRLEGAARRKVSRPGGVNKGPSQLVKGIVLRQAERSTELTESPRAYTTAHGWPPTASDNSEGEGPVIHKRGPVQRLPDLGPREGQRALRLRPRGVRKRLVINRYA